MKGRLIFGVVIVIVIIAIIYFDIAHYFSFESIKTQQQSLQTYVSIKPVLSMLIFFVLYIVAVTFSIPGATVLTLLAGALFGLLKGLILVSFASTIGATLAFLGARYIFKDAIQHKFGSSLATINKGIETEGAFYLFGLRLVPLFPFFLINLLMAITPIRTSVFYLASQAGMLPGTLVYVNAGTQLSKLESASSIFSPVMILSFALLAIFPFLAKKVLAVLKHKQLERDNEDTKKTI